MRQREVLFIFCGAALTVYQRQKPTRVSRITTRVSLVRDGKTVSGVVESLDKAPGPKRVTRPTTHVSFSPVFPSPQNLEGVRNLQNCLFLTYIFTQKQFKSRTPYRVGLGH